MDNPVDERKRRAAIRREKILAGAQERLESIHGRKLDNFQAASPQETVPKPPPAEVEPLPREMPSVGEGRSEGESEKVTSTTLLEGAALAMRVTQRTQTVIAIGLAFLNGRIGVEPVSPLTSLMIAEFTVIVAAWMYFRLHPTEQLKQVQWMRKEMKIRRESGFHWRPSFLYLIPGVRSGLNAFDDLRLCFRAFYANVAVFVVLFVLLRQFTPSPDDASEL